MVDERKLEKYYSQIAEQLDGMIPVEWDKIIMYAEEDGSISSVSFYYYINNGTELHYSNAIPEEYNIEEDAYGSLVYELMDINREFRKVYKEMEDPTWVSFIFRLDSDWNFEIEYKYEQDESVSWYEREIGWAYDEFGIVPEEEFEKKMLEEYLEWKENH